MLYDKQLRKFLERYPASQLQDVFKFFYQSILGPGHLIASYRDALELLKAECQDLRFIFTTLEEPLTEELGNDTIRVNLRPYAYKKYPLEVLAQTFYDSQPLYSTNPQDLLEALEENRVSISILFERYSDQEFESLLLTLKEFGCKPFSHSLNYRNNYQPHYRIVKKSVFLKHLGKVEVVKPTNKKT